MGIFFVDMNKNQDQRLKFNDFILAIASFSNLE